MIPKCYPGDLAIVIDAYNTSNIGTIVKIIGLHFSKHSISPIVWRCTKYTLTWRNRSEFRQQGFPLRLSNAHKLPSHSVSTRGVPT